MKLPHVLSDSAKVDMDLWTFRADDLKKAARFWVGKGANQYAKAKCVEELEKVFRRKSVGKDALAELSKKEKSVLQVVALYGPYVSGSVLSAELRERGLIELPDESQPYYYHHRDRTVESLVNRLVLLSGSQTHYFGFGYDSMPDVMLHPVLVKVVEPADPLPWKVSEPLAKAQPAFSRPPAEPALELWRVAMALEEMGNWKTVKGDALSKGSRNKLRKLVPLRSAEDDEFALPDPESFYYELLRRMGYLSIKTEARHVLGSKLEEHFSQAPVVQAWQWVRAWMDIFLWQDGIGVVPDRDSDFDTLRIYPDSLRSAKEMLVWSLSRVAHSQQEWFELEGFLTDLWEAAQRDRSSFYWDSYTWAPNFPLAKDKKKYPGGRERSLVFWFDSEGMWFANAIMVTLANLGLVERGRPTGKANLPPFRLTETGRYVFGAPELEAPEPPAPKRFLTVQANYDILAFYDEANTQQICKLARFADPDSTSGGPVETFKLTRESVYGGLEDGMTMNEIESFLVQNSKNEIPSNIIRTLQDWSGKRESLVLRCDVTVALAPDTNAMGNVSAPARMVTETCAVLPRMSKLRAAADFDGWALVDHHAQLPRVWKVDEMGQLEVQGHNVVADSRLACLAEKKKDGWVVSEKSVSAARKQGFTTDQLLGWLTDHLTHPAPPLLVTAIRNWLGRSNAFLGKVHLIQITRVEAYEAVLQSKAFESLIAGHLPPDWLIVKDEKVTETKKLLERLGFRLDDTYEITLPSES